MSDAPMCAWCGSTGHTLVDCVLAPPPEPSSEGLNMVAKFKMADIVSIINKLDSLPPDHEPDKSDLWEAIRRIEDIAKSYVLKDFEDE